MHRVLHCSNMEQVFAFSKIDPHLIPMINYALRYRQDKYRLTFQHSLSHHLSTARHLQPNPDVTFAYDDHFGANQNKQCLHRLHMYTSEIFKSKKCPTFISDDGPMRVTYDEFRLHASKLERGYNRPNTPTTPRHNARNGHNLHHYLPDACLSIWLWHEDSNRFP